MRTLNKVSGSALVILNQEIKASVSFALPCFFFVEMATSLKDSESLNGEIQVTLADYRHPPKFGCFVWEGLTTFWGVYLNMSAQLMEDFTCPV